jgi:hypothetical protein
MRIAHDWLGFQPVALESDEQQLRTLSQAVFGALDQIDREMGSAMGSRWRGDAAEAFRANWGADRGAIHDFAEVAGNVADRVATALDQLIRLEYALELAADEAEATGVPIDRRTGVVLPGTPDSSARLTYAAACEYVANQAVSIQRDLAGYLQLTLSCGLLPDKPREFDQLSTTNDVLGTILGAPELASKTFADKYKQTSNAARKATRALTQALERGDPAAIEAAQKAAQAAADKNAMVRGGRDASAALNAEASGAGKLSNLMEKGGYVLAIGGMAFDVSDDLAKGESLPFALFKEGGADIGGMVLGNMAGSAAGAWVAGGLVGLGGGPILVGLGGGLAGVVVAYGVSDLVANGFHEDWAGDFQRDGAAAIFTGSGHVVTQTIGDFGNAIGGIGDALGFHF